MKKKRDIIIGIGILGLVFCINACSKKSDNKNNNTQINQNLKAVSRLIKIQRFFTILAFSLIIWISISSVISMISQNPSKKKIYSYLQGEKGIARIVVYETTENYITQNAKIIENYNGKILILDTRSFYW